MVTSVATPASASAGRAAKLTATVLVVGIIALQMVLVATHRVVIDDAFISFRYLDNWLGGQGLVFNPGERVEGYTNFLWILALAPLRLAGLSPETAALSLSLLSLGALLWSVSSLAAALSGGWLGGVYAITLLSASANLAFWTGAGLETVFLTALLALANRELVVRGKHTPRSSLFFGLAVLTRPDAVLFFVAAAAAALHAEAETGAWNAFRRNVVAGLVFVLLPAAHLVFRRAYYGEWLPNTYYTKLGGVGGGLLLDSGLPYLRDFLVAGGAVLIVTACLFRSQAPGRAWAHRALIVQFLLQSLYAVRVGGEGFAYFRFILPALPALAVLGGAGLAGLVHGGRLRSAWWIPGLALPVAALTLALELRSGQEGRVSASRQFQAEREIIARWLATRFQPPATLAINAAGSIPYRTGLPTIDMLGLNDRHIARAAVKSSLGGAQYAGHHKHDGGYVFRRAPDVVLAGGAILNRGASAREAIYNAAVLTFEGDREFFREPGFEAQYRPLAEELAPGGWVVAYVKKPLEPGEIVGPRGETSADGWTAVGIQKMGLTKFTEAVAAFEKALALDPRHVPALTNLAYCYHDLKLDRTAIPLFERAQSLDPNSLETLYGLALALQSSGAPDRAIPVWERYLSQAPASDWKERARRFLEEARAAQPPQRRR